MVKAKMAKTDWAADFMSDPTRRRAVGGSSMYNKSHSSDDWDRSGSIDLEEVEYYTYERQQALRANKEAKLKSTTVRAHYKGKGNLES